MSFFQVTFLKAIFWFFQIKLNRYLCYTILACMHSAYTWIMLVIDILFVYLFSVVCEDMFVEMHDLLPAKVAVLHLLPLHLNKRQRFFLLSSISSPPLHINKSLLCIFSGPNIFCQNNKFCPYHFSLFLVIYTTTVHFSFFLRCFSI